MNRRTFIKRMNWALAGIIGVLGFGGCEKDTVAVYTVQGTVHNKRTGKPIEGIRVGYSSNSWGMQKYGVPTTPYNPKAHVLTNAKGEFKLTDNFHNEEFQKVDNKPTLPVCVEDIDGEENGLFQAEYLNIDTSKAKYNRGEYSVTVNVELTEIVNE